MYPLYDVSTTVLGRYGYTIQCERLMLDCQVVVRDLGRTQYMLVHGSMTLEKAQAFVFYRVARDETFKR